MDRCSVTWRFPSDNDRLMVEHKWLGKVSDIKTAIEVWLAKTERNANVDSECLDGNADSGYRCYRQNTLHSGFPLVEGPKQLHVRYDFSTPQVTAR